MYKIRRLQPESYSRMKRGSSEMPPRDAKVIKKSVTQSISSGFFRFSYKNTSIMYIFNTTDPQERLQQLIDIREDLNNRLSVLIRHYTGLSATLLALLTLFGDIGSFHLLPRILLIVCMTCLLASVLSGVWCCMAMHLTLEKTLKTLIDKVGEGQTLAQGRVSAPAGFSFFVKFCPTMLCLGVLLLWTSAIVVLFF